MATFTTYAEWYNHPDNDPYHGDYSTLFPVYALPGLQGTTDLRITNSITCGTDAKTAFLFLGDDGTLHLLHRVRRFTPALGMPAAVYDNHDFATFDDTTLTGPTTVELPAGFFHALPNAIAVLTSAAVSLQIADDPDSPQHTPEPMQQAALQAAGSVTNVRVRKAMAIPPDITGAVLASITSPQGLTPRTLWQTFIAPILLDPARTVTCTPFIDWSRVAYAAAAGVANPLAFPIPAPRHLAPPLGHERLRILRADLSPPAGVPAPGLATLVAELALSRREAADRDTTRRLQDQQQKVAASLPTKRWGTGLSRLLRLCQCNGELDLPTVWLDMAQNGVKADITTVRSHLHLPQPDLGPGGISQPPVCTTEMAKALGRLEFQTHPDAIESGIHIFGICHPTQDSITKANDIAGIFAEQILGITGLSVAENLNLKKAQDLLLPVSLLELKYVLFGYHRFLAVILGPYHPVVVALGALTHRLQANEMTHHLFFQNKLHLCASFLRFVQLRMYYWIELQLASDIPIPPPVFASVLDDIVLDCWKPPSLPAAYLAKPTPPPRQSYAAAAASPPLPALGVLVQPNPSDAYFDVAPNLHDSALQLPPRFNPRQFIRTHGPPPSNSTNNPMCLNYHVKHRCRFDCDRLGDHRQHTPVETARLNAYLTSPAVAAPAAPAAPVPAVP